MLKRFYNGSFTDVGSVKIRKNGAWQNASFLRRWDAASRKWVDLLGDSAPTGQQTKTYNLVSSQNYWSGGSKDNQFPKELIQGKWTSTSIRRALMWFDPQLVADLQGATINKIELYLYRMNTTHGNSGGANVKIKTHNQTAVPSTWSGTDTGNADSGTPTLKRGEEKWLTLLNSVGEGLRDGTIKGLALDADSSTAAADYCRCEAAKTKLRITFTR